MDQSKLKVDVIVSEPFYENTYIVYINTGPDCIIVDPGFEPAKVDACLTQRKLTPAAILNTHGHADHIAGNQALKDKWPACPLVIGAGDALKLTDSELNLSAGYGAGLTSPPADVLLTDGDHYAAAGVELEVLDTPGHSQGHVVFLWRGARPWIVFGGDLLFQRSIGRTDFPDGDFEQLVASIHQKLFVLADETIVLPGHGEATTIGDEKRLNPFVGMPAGYNLN